MLEILRRTLFNWRVILVCLELIFSFLYLRRRPGFPIRMLLWIPFFLFLDTGFTTMLGIPPSSNWFVLFGVVNLSYVLQFFLTLVILYICFDENINTILFFGTASYIIQHLYSSLANFVLCLFDGQETLFYLWIRIVLTIGTVLLTWAIFGVWFRKKIVNVDNTLLTAFSFATIMIISIFHSLVRDFFAIYNFATYLYAAITCLLLIQVQFGFMNQAQSRQEQENMENLLRFQAKQQRQQMENINIINMKCHDLKHQIAALRQMTSQDERNRSIGELEDAVMIYDTGIKTGNPALDVLLTEKNFICLQNHICFSAVTDAAAISFLSVQDMYSLLGNALDNAIEASLQLKDKEDRQISLNIDKKGGITYVTLENRYTGELHMDKNGELETTKGDRAMHGFGTKSIRYIVEKYGGHMTVNLEQQRYQLRILFFGEA